MAKDVFISYKAEEFDQANWVRTALESCGIGCWMAPESIPGGTSYATEIPRAIGECTVFVLILSPKAMESKWVPREIDQAINKEKIILPFMIEECELTDEFRFYLTNVQCYMAFRDRNDSLEKLAGQIQILLGGNEEPGEESGPVTGPDKTAAGGVKPVGAALGGARNGPVDKVVPMEPMAVAGFVCAAVLFCGLSFANVLGYVLALVAAFLTIRGRAKIEKTGKRGKKLALAALLMVLFSIPVSVLAMTIGVAGVFLWLIAEAAVILLYRRAAGKRGKKNKRRGTTV